VPRLRFAAVLDLELAQDVDDMDAGGLHAEYSRSAACRRRPSSSLQLPQYSGQRTPSAMAGEVGEVTDPARAMEPAVAAGNPEMAEVRSDTVGCSHPLVRAAVDHDLPVARRCGRHGRAADASTGAARLEHRAAATIGTEAALTAALVAQAQLCLAQARGVGSQPWAQRACKAGPVGAGPMNPDRRTPQRPARAIRSAIVARALAEMSIPPTSADRNCALDRR
jgi:hypothetical protein